MDIKERLVKTNALFEQKERERNQHTQAAEECFIEMTKLQGEYRLLQDMAAEQDASDKKRLNKKTGTIEVDPEEVK